MELKKPCRLMYKWELQQESHAAILFEDYDRISEILDCPNFRAYIEHELIFDMLDFAIEKKKRNVIYRLIIYMQQHRCTPYK